MTNKFGLNNTITNTTMTLQEFKELIFQIYINDAKNALYSVEKSKRSGGQGITNAPANSWGGYAFAALPDSISFYNVQDFIEEYEKEINKK